jgi:hypothetical protein
MIFGSPVVPDVHIAYAMSPALSKEGSVEEHVEIPSLLTTFPHELTANTGMSALIDSTVGGAKKHLIFVVSMIRSFLSSENVGSIGTAIMPAEKILRNGIC